MDDAAFYKAKEEITDFCQTYIDKKFETEKSLIKEYMGFAAKIAIAGIGIAILTVGFFGLKTYDDVNKSIQAEIKSRFDNENPVAKYEGLVKEAAIDGVIASLTARIQQNSNFFSGEDSLGFLTRALQDDLVSAERKSQILDFAVLIPYTNYRDPLARAARKLIQFDFKDNRESGVRVMSSLLKLYSFADANSFVTDALNILEKYKEETIVVKRVAEMLDKVDAGNGNRIVTKLAMSQNPVSHFHVVMFDLRTNPEAKLDTAWLVSIVQKAIDNGSVFSFRDNEDVVSLSEIMIAINRLKVDDKNVWTLCEIFANEARQRGLKIIFSQQSEYGDQNGKPYVGLAQKSSTQFVERQLYSSLFLKVAKAFFVRSLQLSKPTAEDLSVLEFWSAKQSDGSKLTTASSGPEGAVNYKPFFLYSSSGDIKNEAGTIIAQERPNKLLAIRVEQENARPILRVYWRDPLGVLNQLSVLGLMGVERSGFRIRTGVGDADSEIGDDL
jgi:hypothetical protein